MQRSGIVVIAAVPNQSQQKMGTKSWNLQWLTKVTSSGTGLGKTASKVN
jgi:hypothetical protein